jgi:hypothetical protein
LDLCPCFFFVSLPQSGNNENGEGKGPIRPGTINPGNFDGKGTINSINPQKSTKNESGERGGQRSWLIFSLQEPRIPAHDRKIKEPAEQSTWRAQDISQDWNGTKQWNLIRTEGEKNLRYRMLRERRESGRDRALQRPPRIYSLRALRLREEGKSNGPGTEEKAKMERECRCRYISAGTGRGGLVYRWGGAKGGGPWAHSRGFSMTWRYFSTWRRGASSGRKISRARYFPLGAMTGGARGGLPPSWTGRYLLRPGGCHCQASETRCCAGRAWSLAGCRQGRTRDLKRHFAKNIIRCIVYEQ